MKDQPAGARAPAPSRRRVGVDWRRLVATATTCAVLSAGLAACESRRERDARIAADVDAAAFAALSGAVPLNPLFQQQYGELVSITGTGHMRGFKTPGFRLMRTATFEKGQLELRIWVTRGEGPPAMVAVSLKRTPPQLHHFYANALTDAERMQLAAQILPKLTAREREDLAAGFLRGPAVRDAVCLHLTETLTLMQIQRDESISMTMTHQDWRP